jgi:uncharacterized coiled-coil protein SlyX
MSKYKVLYEIAIDTVQELEEEIVDLKEEIIRTKKLLDYLYKNYKNEKLNLNTLKIDREIN